MLKDTVLITGVTGFLGSHVCQQVLKDCPDLKIRCSQRSNAKAEVLKKTFHDDFERIEWVEADLTNQQQINEAVKGCQYVIHCASPIPGVGTGSNNDYMIKVAQEGMFTMLQACKEHKVKKLIVTASVATMSGSAWKGNENPIYDEADFAIDHPMAVVDGYV